MNKTPQHLKEGENYFRAFYGNVCSVCFSKTNLKKCVTCKQAVYCSEEHRQSDLVFHKRICSMLANMNPPRDSNDQEFFYHRWNKLMTIRRGLGSLPLTQYEKEICILPWVCMVCRKTENLNYGCLRCGSVSYCSFEHKRIDMKSHRLYCPKFHLCRVFSSLGFENGTKIQPRTINYQAIPQERKIFPEGITELLRMLQTTITTARDEVDVMNGAVFTERYAAAATILSCLERIGVIADREFNWLPHKRLYEIADMVPRPRNPNPKMSGQLIIHMVAAYDYEIFIPWKHFIGLILDWLKNVHFIKIILVGVGMQGFSYNDRDIRHIAKIQCLPLRYKDVFYRLDKPDIVLLHNVGYPNMDSLEEFLYGNGKVDLFKHRNVPVIITGAFRHLLAKADDSFRELPDVDSLLENMPNQFCECQAVRFWDSEKLQVGQLNQYVSVLMYN